MPNYKSMASLPEATSSLIGQFSLLFGMPTFPYAVEPSRPEVTLKPKTYLYKAYLILPDGATISWLNSMATSPLAVIAPIFIFGSGCSSARNSSLAFFLNSLCFFLSASISVPGKTKPTFDFLNPLLFNR
jgi:hypothetical protein